VTLAREATYFLAQSGVLVAKVRHEFFELFARLRGVVHVLRLPQNPFALAATVCARDTPRRNFAEVPEGAR
jgi:hypothetical protein